MISYIESDINQGQRPTKRTREQNILLLCKGDAYICCYRRLLFELVSNYFNLILNFV